MKPLIQYPRKDWLLWPECARIMEVLNSSPTTSEALFVGGCVRDFVYGQTAQDIDIATIHKPKKVQQICTEAGLKTFPTGIEHGTLTVLVGERTFEVTTLRKDIETDGRRAIISYTDNWGEDAARRDFTINAIYADMKGTIYDPTHQGIDDLNNKKVRFIGNAAERIQEDYLRILRFFRFHGRYGEGVHDPEGLKACSKYAAQISTLSRERITQEFLKILMGDRGADSLEIMRAHNILHVLIPSDLQKWTRLCARQIKYAALDVTTRIYFLLQQNRTSIEGAEKYLIFTNAQKKRFIEFDVIRAFCKEEKSTELLLYMYGAEVLLQYNLMFASEDTLERELPIMREWQRPVFPVNGQDLIDLGMTPGPVLGSILKAVEKWWIDHNFKPEKAACLKCAQSLNDKI